MAVKGRTYHSCWRLMYSKSPRWLQQARDHGKFSKFQCWNQRRWTYHLEAEAHQKGREGVHMTFPGLQRGRGRAPWGSSGTRWHIGYAERTEWKFEFSATSSQTHTNTLLLLLSLSLTSLSHCNLASKLCHIRLVPTLPLSAASKRVKSRLAIASVLPNPLN